MAKIKNYSEAVKELEGILEALKSDKIAIDKLAEKVERSNDLLAYCQEILRKTEKVILD